MLNDNVIQLSATNGLREVAIVFNSYIGGAVGIAHIVRISFADRTDHPILVE